MSAPRPRSPLSRGLSLGALTHRSARVRAALITGLAIALFPALAATADAQKKRAGATTQTGGGGLFVKQLPKPAPDEVAGAKAKLTRNGTAIPPAGAPPKVKKVIRAGNKIAKKPYKWGGGHGRRLRDSGYDCSGSISFALRKARLMSSPLASTGFMSWGRRGRGKWITIRANAGHAYMIVAGLRFDTSARKATGSRWTDEMRSPRGYRATHPVGF